MVTSQTPTDAFATQGSKQVFDSTASQEIKPIYISAREHPTISKVKATAQAELLASHLLHSSICRMLTGVRRRMTGIDLMVVWEELSMLQGENTSCSLADGTEMCCTASSGRRNVLRTQHL